MRRLTGGEERVRVAGSTVRQIIESLEKKYPGIQGVLCDDDGIAPNLAVIVDGETSNLGMLERVREDSEIHFLPAIGGG